MSEPVEVGLVATAAMHARRHPWAIAGVWAWETALAILFAWPARSFASAAYGAGPSGDAALWAPGGHPLLDLLFHDPHAVRALFSEAAVLLFAAGIAGIVPMAAMLVAIAYATREKRSLGFAWCLHEGVRLFPPLALQFVILGIAETLVVVAGVALGALVQAWVHGSGGEPRAQQLQLLVIALFITGAALLGVVRDLSAAAVIRFNVTGARGIAIGARMWRLTPLSLTWSWTWRALASLAPMAAGAWVADRLGGRGGMPLFVLLVLHQCIVVSRVALRASWLARALRAVDTAFVRRAT